MRLIQPLFASPRFLFARSHFRDGKRKREGAVRRKEAERREKAVTDDPQLRGNSQAARVSVLDGAQASAQRHACKRTCHKHEMTRGAGHATRTVRLLRMRTGVVAALCTGETHTANRHATHQQVSAKEHFPVSSHLRTRVTRVTRVMDGVKRDPTAMCASTATARPQATPHLSSRICNLACAFRWPSATQS